MEKILSILFFSSLIILSKANDIKDPSLSVPKAGIYNKLSLSLHK